MDEVRVLKGQAAWTANFTPPGGPYTNEPDMGAGAQMQFSNDNFTWSDPENYATTKNWTLSSGDGTKTVYVKFKDAAGNWSDVFSDTIILNSGGLTTTTIDYIYDDLNRLNTVTHSGISATTYTYDELGNMKNQTTTRGAP